MLGGQASRPKPVAKNVIVEIRGGQLKILEKVAIQP